MRIGALAEITGVPAKTLRYWEGEGLLPHPDRTRSGYRDYPPGAAHRVAFVRHAQAAGLTLRQISDILAIRDEGQPPCEHAAALVDQRIADVAHRLSELQHTHAALHQLRRRLARLDPADCDPATFCSAFTAPARSAPRQSP